MQNFFWRISLKAAISKTETEMRWWWWWWWWW